MVGVGYIHFANQLCSLLWIYLCVYVAKTKSETSHIKLRKTDCNQIKSNDGTHIVFFHLLFNDTHSTLFCPIEIMVCLITEN